MLRKEHYWYKINTYYLNSSVSVWRSLVLQIVGRFSVFINVGERSTAKNYCPVSLLSVVSKVFEKLVNNRIVDHLEKCDLFSDFQYGFRSSWSTADLLTVVSDRIARAFARSGATRAVALDVSKAFDRVWHAGLLHKLKVRLSPSKNFFVIFLIEKWSTMLFISSENLFSFSRYSSFCHDFFVM